MIFAHLNSQDLKGWDRRMMSFRLASVWYNETLLLTNKKNKCFRTKLMSFLFFEHITGSLLFSWAHSDHPGKHICYILQGSFFSVLFSFQSGMNLGFKFASIKWCMESETKALLYPPLDQSKWTGQFIQDILRQWSICLIKELFKVEHFEPFIWVISQLGDTFEFYFLPSPINQKRRGNIVSWNFKKKMLNHPP